MQTTQKPLNILGYIRVSTSKQDVGPEAQAAALQDAAELNGWNLTIIKENAVSAKSIRNRPVLLSALADLKSKKYDGLAVSKLDRLSRSVADFAAILETSTRQHWTLICLDLGIDTSTVTGSAMAHITCAIAEMERRRIGERVSDWHQVKRSRGERTGGVSKLPEATVARVLAERSTGASMAAIAQVLNTEGVPTAAGGHWYASTIRQVMHSTTATKLQKEGTPS